MNADIGNSSKVPLPSECVIPTPRVFTGGLRDLPRNSFLYQGDPSLRLKNGSAQMTPLGMVEIQNGPATRDRTPYNRFMEKKIFWLVFTLLGLFADFLLPFWYAVAATLPIIFISWWVAYRSDWFS
jgi:hypothetical protein